MLAVYVWHTVIPHFPNLPKTSNIAVFVSKTIKKGRQEDTKRLLKEFEKGSKITLLIAFHRLKGFLFSAVTDTVQEKLSGNFIYRAAARKEAGLSVSLYSREDLVRPEQILHRGHGQERVVHPCSVW